MLLARQAASEMLTTEPESAAPETLDARRLREDLIAAGLKLADDMEGGFGRQNRFPMAPQLSVLLDHVDERKSPDTASRFFRNR